MAGRCGVIVGNRCCRRVRRGPFKRLPLGLPTYSPNPPPPPPPCSYPPPSVPPPFPPLHLPLLPSPSLSLPLPSRPLAVSPRATFPAFPRPVCASPPPLLLLPPAPPPPPPSPPPPSPPLTTPLRPPVGRTAGPWLTPPLPPFILDAPDPCRQTPLLSYALVATVSRRTPGARSPVPALRREARSPLSSGGAPPRRAGHDVYPEEPAPECAARRLPVPCWHPLSPSTTCCAERATGTPTEPCGERRTPLRATDPVRAEVKSAGGTWSGRLHRFARSALGARSRPAACSGCVRRAAPINNAEFGAYLQRSAPTM